MKPCVVVESPYAGDIAQHLNYARHCMLNSLVRGEAPFLSHLLYPQVLEDSDPKDRAEGLAAAQAWISKADILAVYVDLGISPGMTEAIKVAEGLIKAGQKLIIDRRRLVLVNPNVHR